MFAQQQYRPEIARIAEETVTNLKQLEGRIEVLKVELAQLCTVVGHPEAARLAITPIHQLGLGVGAVSPWSNVGTPGLNPYTNLSPYGAISPYTNIGTFGIPNVSPFGIDPRFGGFGIDPRFSQVPTPFSPLGGIGQGVGFAGPVPTLR